MHGEIIQFLRSKDFKFIKEIGQGGLGRTVLLEDEIINERFVCKKYAPIYDEYKQVFFKNFKDEIKLLHLLNHENIVRVFNYYLYPENHTGYILMEYIEGNNISNFLKENPDLLNDIFQQAINGFAHLEKSNILHRDIRPDNILISNEGVLKIIDFGFSKKIDFVSDLEKSISLNWRYAPPSEFQEQRYDFRTELYFIGKLFEEIILENDFTFFRYNAILKNMLNADYDKRIQSFFDVKRAIISESASEVRFTPKEKEIYQNFAIKLEGVFSEINSDAIYKEDVSHVIKALKEVHQNSILEDFVQNISSIANCFIKGGFRYWKNTEIRVDTVSNFLSLLSSSSKEKQKVILNNLWQRLDKIDRNYPVIDDDLPF